jgi:DNA mismatch repair protein MutS
MTQWGDDIVFLHQMVRGKAQGSYGLHVARMAGIPQGVLERARALQDQLTSQRSVVEEALEALDVTDLSPADALAFLKNLKNRLSSSFTAKAS